MSMGSQKNQTQFADEIVVVAHPDDEAIFFGGWILSRPNIQRKIICVTDGNADGQGAARRKQFSESCKRLGAAESEMWDYPDIYDRRLDIQKLTDDLNNEFKRCKNQTIVMTHGPIGEYAHPHHQDVCMASHYAARALPQISQVMSVAWNCSPEIFVQLSKDVFNQRAALLRDIYFDETKRFITQLPAAYCEGFVSLELAEIETIYKYFAQQIAVDPRQVKKYQWLVPYFSFIHERIQIRPF